MQTPGPARINRIPRVASPRAGLCGRLHCWLQRTRLQWQIADLQAERALIQHEAALDQAAIAVHQLRYEKCPTLRQAHRAKLDQVTDLDIRLMLADAELKTWLVQP